MNEKPKPNTGQSTKPSTNKSIFKPNLANEVKLVWGLMHHPDVPTRLKLIPVFALVYLVWPWDLAFGPFDDAAVLWLATTFFIDLCPPHAVMEVKELIANPAIKIRPRRSSDPVDETNVVEGEFHEVGSASKSSAQGPATPPQKPAGKKVQTGDTTSKDPNSL